MTKSAGSMVIARLWGGLGNQMFQYAAGLGLAKFLGVSLRLDPTQCFADRNRPYELDRLKVSGRIWTLQERRWIEPMVRLTRPLESTTHGYARLLKAATARLLKNRFTYLNDCHQGYQRNVYNVAGHVYMAGTWASAEYFEGIAAEVRSEFAFSKGADDENMRMLNRIGASAHALCVHVRRGDYLSVEDTSRRFGTCSLEYYDRAFKHIAERVSGIKAFVFSDDPAWTAASLHLPCETVYVSHNTGRQNSEDLRLMASCRHFIIANSTFSWWGAWLSIHSDKLIVAPRQWRLDPNGIADPVPHDWIRL